MQDKDLETLRHSTSHVMAQAMKELYPDARLGIGPAIEEGFYYDFDLGKTLGPEDLPAIEKKMKEIIKNDIAFVREEIRRDEAVGTFKTLGEKYKVELLEGMENGTVSVYRQGDFIDLCRGPHINKTGLIRHFKLLSVAGSYWRGDEKRPMLQRIYGTAFKTAGELEEYLKQLEEARKRDHRKLGKELDLFSLHEEAGPGLVIYHPKGTTIRRQVEAFEIDEHIKRGYQVVSTPHIYKADLWKISGHYDFYRENMYFFGTGNDEYAVKPMNCPGHVLIYKTKTRSYRDLPLRYFEFGTVYRNERSGVMHGIMRAKGFTQDDAHIFCTREQLKDEINGVLDFARFMMQTFGFGYEVQLSTRPEKYIGALENWGHAEGSLKNALEENRIEYSVAEGEGVFYGPKIDISMKDVLNRKWQGPTIQVDFNFPEKFDLKYSAEDGTEKRVVMIHRTVLGSWERFFGVLIEHYGGAFPVWLAPVQATVLPIADRHFEYARKIEAELAQNGIRCETDARNEKINKKVRDAQVAKIPYALIVGDKEVTDRTVSLRSRTEGDVGAITPAEFIEKLRSEIKSRR